MTIERNFFRRVLGCFTTGVTVVTTGSEANATGLTVNAFCSVSLDPPLVLVCIDRKSRSLPTFYESQAFVVNILTEDQKHLSTYFAAHTRECDEYFRQTSYSTAITGAPILHETLAFVEARIIAEYPGGDHSIFLGLVVSMGTAGRVAVNEEIDLTTSIASNWQPGKHRQDASLPPLTFYGGQYCRLAGPSYELVANHLKQ